MWLFTKQGFFSAVENFNDPDFIHVRARWREDLEKLEEVLRLPRLESTFDYPMHDESKAPWNNKNVNLKIQETPSADYPFRMDVTRDEWKLFLKKAASEIDYPNFKNAVHAKGGSDDRLMRYHEIWRILKLRKGENPFFD